MFPSLSRIAAGIVLLGAFCLSGPAARAGTPTGPSATAVGYVFHDINGNRMRDPGEPGLGNIAVSNGREVVLTDLTGRYELPVSDDTILFVIKPSGWMTPVDEDGIPRFYYIHKPAGSPPLRYPGVAPTGPLPPSIDFPLYPREEPDRFRVLVFGDTQPRNMAEVEFHARDVVAELIGFDGAFAVSLGDLVFDNLDMLEPINRVNALIGVPFYNVLGNHDTNQDAPDDAGSTETFQRIFGPPYYAFAHGPVHFLVVDNIHWKGTGYHAEIEPAQIEFFRNYLRRVDPDRLVVALMHIPLNELRNRREFFEILGRFPHTFSISAHWHVQDHFFLGAEHGWPREEPHHHLVSATACGGWWTGARDEVGLPHATMPDGVPNGYSIVTFDGASYSVEFKAARRPADYQMDISLPNAVAAEDVASTEVVVNVFAGSPRSVTEMRIDGRGPWTLLDRQRRLAPTYVDLKAREEKLRQLLFRDLPEDERAGAQIHHLEGSMEAYGRRLPRPAESNHLWAGRLPAGLSPGMHSVEVRTTDMFGRVYTARQPFRVLEPQVGGDATP